MKIARGAIHTLPNCQQQGPSTRWQDWLWAMSTDKVYGFDTELTLLKLTDLSGECYTLMVL